MWSGNSGGITFDHRQPMVMVGCMLWFCTDPYRPPPNHRQPEEFPQRYQQPEHEISAIMTPRPFPLNRMIATFRSQMLSASR
ncbi:N-6 DNA methylase [Anopheles sinensis]|uniref:N-6 DNA methylase n=1 Tax=Anopheles sinensis TaxID=74873 RepID=A0A084VX17_ANOSI|nr:N-6 DNA methylase [Anopheles sinensis]